MPSDTDITGDESEGLISNADDNLNQSTSNNKDTSLTGTNDSPKSLFQALVKLFNSKKPKDGKLGIATAFFIMVSMSFGSSVLIMPHTVKQLGWVIFSVNISWSFLILAFCAVLLKESCVHVMMKHKDHLKEDAISRDPYPIVAELTVGKRFAFLLEATMFVALIANTLAFLLLGATTMNQVLPLGFTYYNRIRVWLMIEFVTVLPFMMIGSFNDLNMTAFMSVFTSSIATICIFCVSVFAKLHYGAKTSQFVTIAVVGPPHQKESMFKIFGEIMFAAAGPALLLPNIIVLLRKPAKFRSPIISSHIFVLVLYVILATVPYLVFGQKVQPSIMDTLNDAIVSLGMSSFWLSVVTLAEIALVIHFAMVSVLCANPVFLNLEEKLSFPTSMCYVIIIISTSIDRIVASQVSNRHPFPYVSP